MIDTRHSPLLAFVQRVRGANQVVNNPFRAFFFGNYWWIASLFAIFACWAIFTYSQKENVPTALVTLCGATFSVVFFIQKQHGEDLQIFERLFTRFNERYAALHANLRLEMNDITSAEMIPSEPLE